MTVQLHHQVRKWKEVRTSKLTMQMQMMESNSNICLAKDVTLNISMSVSLLKRWQQNNIWGNLKLTSSQKSAERAGPLSEVRPHTFNCAQGGDKYSEHTQ